MCEERRLLSAMMPLTTLTENRSPANRLFAGTGLLLLLVGIVFVPLWSAFILCTMPCCHSASTPLTSATNQNPCCTISPSDTGNNAVAISPVAIKHRALAAAGTAKARIFLPVSPTPAAAALARHVSHSLERPPLHILNSVFLI